MTKNLKKLYFFIFIVCLGNFINSNEQIEAFYSLNTQLNFLKNLIPKIGFDYQDFNSWYKACKEKLPANINGTSYQTTLTLKEFDKALNGFFNLMKTTNNSFINAKNWLSDAPNINDDLFNSEINPDSVFKPFVQKLVVPTDAIIGFRGDLHGDIHSLLGYLKFLQKNRYLDSKDAFKISNSKFYLVFLGDYVDRGNYGTEVIYTILRLKIANPDRVILIRGNHEDFNICSRYGFETEFLTKFPSKENPSQEKSFNKIMQLYNFLPVALYLGTGSSKIKDFIQCCHGGLEIGFNPTDLLDFPQNFGFTWLKELNQSNEIQQIKQTLSKNKLNPKENSEVNNLEGFFFNIPLEEIKEDRNKYFNIGFMWNDFQVNEKSPTRYYDGRGFRFSKNFTQYALNRASLSNKVRGIFRAHQHTADRDDMMDHILGINNPHDKHKGVSTLWKDYDFIISDSDGIALWDNIVCTFLVGADTVYSQRYYKKQFTFDAFGILKMADKYENWRLAVYRNNLQDLISKK